MNSQISDFIIINKNKFEFDILNYISIFIIFNYQLKQKCITNIYISK